MGLLKFDFNKANAQIQELEEIASEIDQLAATDYENLMQQRKCGRCLYKKGKSGAGENKRDITGY